LIIYLATNARCTTHERKSAARHKAARGGNQGSNINARALYASRRLRPSRADPQGHTCSLLELSEANAAGRSHPGAEDFCFCGNTPIEGLPYCAGHTACVPAGLSPAVARG